MGFASIFLFLLGLLVSFVMGGETQRSSLVTVPSHAGIVATSQTFEERLNEGGFTILVKQVQTPLEAGEGKVLYIFGRPDRLDEDGWVVVDAPQTVVVWESKQGETLLSYERAAADRGIEGEGERLAGMPTVNLPALVDRGIERASIRTEAYVSPVVG